MAKLHLDQKLLYYAQYNKDTHIATPFITLNLASVEKDYIPSHWASAASDANTEVYAAKGNKWDLEALFEMADEVVKDPNLPLEPLEELFIMLLQTPEFDAITKSLLIPATAFNVLQAIPPAEIGAILRKMMRQRGAFKGVDEVLDDFLSLAKNYLFEDFPFLAECSLEGVV